MASSSSSSTPQTTSINKPKSHPPFPPPFFDPNSSPNTTFVQADPSNFRAVVQKLTGATPQAHTPPRFAGNPISGEMAPRKPAFRLLHERRQTARKLEIKLAANANGPAGEMVMVSPVSPLDIFGRGSPRSPKEEEEKAIAEKGFYFHPSPLSTPRGSEPPELLPLFPLYSPRDGSNS